MSLASCNGLTTKDHPPLVFALNLSSSATDLSLVKGSEVLASFPSLGPLESRPLTRVAAADGAVLRFGWNSEWTDPSGVAYNLRFQPGQIYAIIVDPHGKAALYSLPETYSSDPKLCIVNVLAAPLSQVQAAPDWAKNVKVYAQDVAPVVPSEFYSIEPKTLGLYWQTAGQTLEGGHSLALTSDGKPLRLAFRSEHYYLFLAGLPNGEESVRDLTPHFD